MSLTVNLTPPFTASAPRISFPPTGVNLIALVTRLMRTCSTFSWSTWRSGRPGATLDSRLWPFSPARKRVSSVALRTIVSGFAGPRWRVSRPASMRLMSRTSFTRVRSLFEEEQRISTTWSWSGVISPAIPPLRMSAPARMPARGERRSWTIMLMKSAFTASVSSRAARNVRTAAISRSTTARVFRSSAPKDSAPSSIIIRTPGISSPTRIGRTTFEAKTGKIFDFLCPPRIDQVTADSSIPLTWRDISFQTTSRAPECPTPVVRSRWRLTLRGDRTMSPPRPKRKTSWRKSKRPAESFAGSWARPNRSRMRFATTAS